MARVQCTHSFPQTRTRAESMLDRSYFHVPLSHSSGNRDTLILSNRQRRPIAITNATTPITVPRLGCPIGQNAVEPGVRGCWSQRPLPPSRELILSFGKPVGD